MAIKKPSENYILISTKTIFMVVASAVLLWLFVQIKEILLLIFISLMLSLALAPFVEFLGKKKIPRGVAILIIYTVVLSILALVGVVALPPIIVQTTRFINSLPQILSTVGEVPFLSRVTTDLNNFLAEQFIGASGNVIKVTVGAFSGIVSAFSLMVFTAYLLLDLDNLRETFLFFLPAKPRKETAKVLKEIEYKLGAWLRGEFILMCVVGGATYVGLLLLGVEYAAPLALISGLLEVVPMIGPLISAVPGVIVGFSISPIMGLGVLGLYILIQQLENNFIVPKVMQRTVGFNPLITLLALLIGGKLFGVIGALLSVPITLIIVIVTKHVLEYE
ncbi:MAG: AI-2E family transporter [Patescibacteria group bacterium]|nr:AI-2E family transporter [Patescibacteria group bacterium]